MSIASRILAWSVSLTAILVLSAGSTEAADRTIRTVRHASCGFVEGVRGATPLTVPFFGSGWYPGPAHYGPCWRYRRAAVISVKY